MYVGNAKGRCLLVSTVTIIHPSGAETTTEEASKATMVSWATVAATEVQEWPLVMQKYA